jgi:uncharacterized protein YegL
MRKEFSAKLSATDARIARRVSRIEDLEATISENVQEIRADLRKLSDLKTTIVTTAIAAVLAIVFGVASFNAALISNILTALQAGLQGAHSAVHQRGAQSAQRQDAP